MSNLECRRDCDFGRPAPSSLSIYGDLEFVLLARLAIGIPHDMIGGFTIYRYETMILPRLGPDPSSIQDFQFGKFVVRHGYYYRSRQRLALNWNLIGTDSHKSQSHRESHCAMTLSVRLWGQVRRIHYINFTILYNSYGSMLCRLTWRQLPLPEGHQAKRIQKKKKLGKKQVGMISSGFHDEFWQWWNLYH